MKQVIALSLTALTAIVLFSCSKDAVYKEDHLNPTIFGKWNIVTDSGYSGVGLSNHAVNYSGKPGDYFDFRTDGFLYIKEGAGTETLSYTTTSATTMQISSFGIILNGVPQETQVTNLSAHTATLDAPTLFTSGGAFGRKVNLSR